MSYATAQDVSDFWTDASTISEDVMARWISRAQARVDAVLGRRYVVPFDDPVPALVRDLTAEYAAGLIMVKAFTKNAKVNESPVGMAHINAAERQLSRLASGEVSLPGIAQRPNMLSSTDGENPELLDWAMHAEPPVEGLEHWW